MSDHMESWRAYGCARGVYFIEGADLIKIGYSGNIIKRLGSLQTVSPVPLTVLGYIPNEGAWLEEWLHERYQMDRSHGEWFRPSAELRQLALGRRPDIVQMYRDHYEEGRLTA